MAACATLCRISLGTRQVPRQSGYETKSNCNSPWGTAGWLLNEMAELADGAVQASATSNSDAPLQESLDLSGPTLSWADDRHPSRHLLRFLKVWWRTLVVVLTPLLLLPIPLALGDHVRVER